MRKLLPEQHNGIEFIKLSRLPFDQMLHLRNWLSETDLITLRSDGEIVNNCVHYDDYEFWFDIYKSENWQPELSLF